jgi:tRNA nucleotidyltransferase/poly(A) polymerase
MTPDPMAVLQMMQEDDVLAVVLPEARRLERLRQMIAIEPEPDPLRQLAALVEVDGEGALALAARLRFPNAWRDRLYGLAPPWPLDPREDIRAQRRALYRLGAVRYRDSALLQAAQVGMPRRQLGALLDLARSWTPPTFPLAGRDVTALGIPPGEPVGRLLAAVRYWWEEGDFAADRAQCLAYLSELAIATPPA